MPHGCAFTNLIPCSNCVGSFPFVMKERLLAIGDGSYIANAAGIGPSVRLLPLTFPREGGQGVQVR